MNRWKSEAEASYNNVPLMAYCVNGFIPNLLTRHHDAGWKSFISGHKWLAVFLPCSITCSLLAVLLLKLYETWSEQCSVNVN